MLLWIDGNADAGKVPASTFAFIHLGTLLKFTINFGALPVGLYPPNSTQSIVWTQAFRQRCSQVSKWSYGPAGPWNVTRLGPDSGPPVHGRNSSTERLWDTGPGDPKSSRGALPHMWKSTLFWSKIPTRPQTLRAYEHSWTLTPCCQTRSMGLTRAHSIVDPRSRHRLAPVISVLCHVFCFLKLKVY